jgi:WD40 repeat protein
VASGDQCGNLRVWNVENLETKLEIRALGGKINDLEWSEDEKYIAICGEGRDQ